MLHSRDTAGIVPSACGKSCGLASVLPLTHFSTWRDADPSFGRTSALYARALVPCDAESSADEVECSGGVTYYVGYVGARS